jgi:predicted AAA+ superfamily ATPase
MGDTPRGRSCRRLLVEICPSKDKRRFVLTGSSARKLRRGGTDLLAGRAVVRTLHPFMGSELDRFDFQAALLHGLLPLVVAADRPADILRAYASLYLDEEVRMEGWCLILQNRFSRARRSKQGVKTAHTGSM